MDYLRSFIRNVILEAKEKPDSGQFSVGDKIYHGKYKNKKGKIVNVEFDEKHHVTIEVEPEPSNGKKKKNVKMGLYKIWPRENV